MKIPFFSRKKSSSGKTVGSVKVDFKVDDQKEFEKYVKYLSHPFHIMWRNFLAGTFHGLGFILGTALFLTILGYILNSILGELPFFSDLAEAINIWLQSTLENSQ